MILFKLIYCSCLRRHIFQNEESYHSGLPTRLARNNNTSYADSSRFHLYFWPKNYQINIGINNNNRVKLCLLNSVQELTEIEVWLFLTLYLQNQLSKIHFMVTYYRVQMFATVDLSNRQKINGCFFPPDLRQNLSWFLT